MDSGIKLLGYIASALFLLFGVHHAAAADHAAKGKHARRPAMAIEYRDRCISGSRSIRPRVLAAIPGALSWQHFDRGWRSHRRWVPDYCLYRPLLWQPLAGLALAISLIIRVLRLHHPEQCHPRAGGREAGWR